MAESVIPGSLLLSPDQVCLLWGIPSQIQAPGTMLAENLALSLSSADELLLDLSPSLGESTSGQGVEAPHSEPLPHASTVSLWEGPRWPSKEA